MIWIFDEFQKKSDFAKLDIPMPLEHDSPLVEEKKGTDVSYFEMKLLTLFI